MTTVITSKRPVRIRRHCGHCGHCSYCSYSRHDRCTYHHHDCWRVCLASCLQNHQRRVAWCSTGIDGNRHALVRMDGNAGQHGVTQPWHWRGHSSSCCRSAAEVGRRHRGGLRKRTLLHPVPPSFRRSGQPALLHALGTSGRVCCGGGFVAGLAIRNKGTRSCLIEATAFHPKAALPPSKPGPKRKGPRKPEPF